MCAVDKGLLRQQGQRLGLDLDDPFAIEGSGRDVIAGQLAVRRLVVVAQRKQLVKPRIAHRPNPCGPLYRRRITLSAAASSAARLFSKCAAASAAAYGTSPLPHPTTQREYA